MLMRKLNEWVNLPYVANVGWDHEPAVQNFRNVFLLKINLRIISS